MTKCFPVFCFFLLIWIGVRYVTLKQKWTSLKKLNSQLVQYYDELLLEQNRTRSLWHDMKKQINMLQFLIEHDSEQAAKYVPDLTSEFLSLGHLVDCENLAVNYILNDSFVRARIQSISLALHVDVAPIINISPLDLSVILGNTLDNAICACSKLPIANRKIRICLRSHENLLHYEISNVFKESSQKDTNRFHYGLINTRFCVWKNSGHLHINTTNHQFTVCIVLPI